MPEKTTDKKKHMQVSVPEELLEYLRAQAKKEHRSLSNLVALILLKYKNDQEKK